MKSTKIKIEAQVKSNINKVWECYNQPEHIVKWNFASDDWCCPNATCDLKTGGKYFARMEAKNGSSGFDFEAIFDEIAENNKVAYTMIDGRKAETIFSETNDGIHVQVLFDAEKKNPVEMQQQGWQAILDNFKKYVETH